MPPETRRAAAAGSRRGARCPGCGEGLADEGRLATRGDGTAGTELIAECAGCGSARTVSPAPEVEAAHTAATYAQARGAADLLLRPLRQAVDRDRLRVVLGGAPPPGSALEVGSGDGALLDALRSRGVERVVGIEPTAPDGGRPSGARVRGGTLEAAAGSLDAGPFELAILWHSLEHLDRPDEALETVRGALVSGGRLVVAVPNRAGLQARIGGDRWFHQDVPRHRAHFTPEGLARLLRRTGFMPERRHDLILDGGPLGMWQTVLNRLTGQPAFAFRLLKRDPALRVLDPDLLLTVGVGAPLIPLACAAELGAGLLGRGGTMAIVARRA